MDIKSTEASIQLLNCQLLLHRRPFINIHGLWGTLYCVKNFRLKSCSVSLAQHRYVSFFEPSVFFFCTETRPSNSADVSTSSCVVLIIICQVTCLIIVFFLIQFISTYEAATIGVSGLIQSLKFSILKLFFQLFLSLSLYLSLSLSLSLSLFISRLEVVRLKLTAF